MDILQYPNKILTKKIPEYNLEQWEEDTLSTFKMGQYIYQNQKCFSLSAPQVGIEKRMFVLRERFGLRYCFDPQLISHGKDIAWQNEDCMSVEHGEFITPVPRWLRIDVSYIDSHKKRVFATFRGTEARIFQHELEHLSGLLIIKTVADDE